MCYVGWCGFTLLLLAACAPSDRVGSIDAETTNVLLVTLCTVRADHLGAYGYERDTSPNLDALARQGVLFEKVLTPSPWTRPSIASSITGLYPRSLAIEEPDRVGNDRVVDDSFETLAETLSAAGYRTGRSRRRPSEASRTRRRAEIRTLRR